MARYTGAQCKKCRREGQKLFLKGERCNSGKCALDRRNYAPGQHGANKSKLSEYGTQLRAKQKVKIYYGVSELQLRKYYDVAFSKVGVTSDLLFGMLETRLDNVAYRMGIGTSRRQARQLVNYGLLTVNGNMVDVPSYQVRVGDVIAIKENKKDNTALKLLADNVKAKNIVSWIDMNKEKVEAKIVRMPVRADVELDVAENLIIEFYSKS